LKKKSASSAKDFFFKTLKMYTLDLVISLFREFPLFCEIFFLEEKKSVSLAKDLFFLF
jgi:hypothetical protein